MLSVPMQGDIDSIETRQAMARLRHTYIPHAFATAPVTVFVGGSAPPRKTLPGLRRGAAGDPLVLGLSFVPPARVSLPGGPLKAVVLNLLSVGAAYGFGGRVSKGWGHAVLGFQHTATIYGCRSFSSRCCSVSRWIIMSFY